MGEKIASGKDKNTAACEAPVEETAVNMAELNCELIGCVGAAKGLFVEAIDEAMDGNLAAARDLYEQGEEAFLRGHKVHAGLLTRFAQGEEIAVDILTVHAQCQMMSAEDFKVLAQKLIEHREKQR